MLLSRAFAQTKRRPNRAPLCIFGLVASTAAIVVVAASAVVVAAAAVAVETEEDDQNKNDDPPVAVSEAVHKQSPLCVVFEALHTS